VRIKIRRPRALSHDRGRLVKTGVPFGADRGTVLTIKRTICPSYLPKIDFSTASFGARARYIRRRLGLSIIRFSKRAGIAHNSLSKLERDIAVQPEVRVKLAIFLKSRYPGRMTQVSEIFPENEKRTEGP
jgi:hypothetical protein